MDVRAHEPLCVDSLLFRSSTGDWTFTVIVKATFLLAPETSPLMSTGGDEVTTVDVPWDHEVPSSLRYASDLVPFKRYQEVLVTGCAYARPGKPARALLARLGVAGVEKAIEVRGDSYFERDGRLSKPALWTSMPLRWERAAGGPGTANPVGVPPGAGAGEYGRPVVPNLWLPGAAESYRHGSTGIVGFGPIAPDWPERRAYLHRHAASWGLYDLSDRPLPSDFDAAFFNAAPQDQRLSDFSIEDPILLEHLHPQHSRMVTRLEPIGPIATLEAPSRRPLDIPLVCDTLCIISDRGVATLTYRGHLTLDAPDQPGTVVVYLEDTLPTIRRDSLFDQAAPAPESFHRPPPDSEGLPFQPVRAVVSRAAGAGRAAASQAAKAPPQSAPKAAPQAPLQSARQAPLQSARQAPLQAALKSPLQAVQSAPAQAAQQAPPPAVLQVPAQTAPPQEIGPEDLVEASQTGQDEYVELTVTGAEEYIESTVAISHVVTSGNALPFTRGSGSQAAPRQAGQRQAAPRQATPFQAQSAPPAPYPAPPPPPPMPMPPATMDLPAQAAPKFDLPPKSAPKFDLPAQAGPKFDLPAQTAPPLDMSAQASAVPFAQPAPKFDLPAPTAPPPPVASYQEQAASYQAQAAPPPSAPPQVASYQAQAAPPLASYQAQPSAMPAQAGTLGGNAGLGQASMLGASAAPAQTSSFGPGAAPAHIGSLGPGAAPAQTSSFGPSAAPAHIGSLGPGAAPAQTGPLEASAAPVQTSSFTTGAAPVHAGALAATASLGQTGSLGGNATLAQSLHARVSLAHDSAPPPEAPKAFVPAPTPEGVTPAPPGWAAPATLEDTQPPPEAAQALAPAAAPEPPKPAPAPESAKEEPPPEEAKAPPPADAKEPPPLPLEAYPVTRCGAITASIDRKPEEKLATLRSEGLDEVTWIRLEEHWEAAIAKELQRSKNDLMRAHDAAYLDRLEEERGVIAAGDYARMALEAEVSEPSGALAALEIPLEAWPRIRRVWIGRLAKDMKLARIVRNLMDQQR